MFTLYDVTLLHVWKTSSLRLMMQSEDMSWQTSAVSLFTHIREGMCIFHTVSNAYSNNVGNYF